MIQLIDFGQRLKEVRQACGLTQTDLANAIQSNIVTINNYERNTHLGQIEKLVKLCHVLNVTPNVLLGFEYEQEINNKEG